MMPNGFFLGGFAEGAQRSRDSRRADRQLSLQEKALGIEQEATRLETERKNQVAAQKAVSDSLTKGQEIYTQALEGGVPKDKAARLAAVPVLDVMQNPLTLRAAGTTPESVQTQFGAILASVPSPQERAATEGASKATGQVKQAETLTQLGVPEDAAQEASGLSFKEEKTIIAKLQTERDAAAAEGRTADAEQLQARIDNLTTIVGRTEADVASTAGAKKTATEVAKSREEGRQEAAQRSLDVANIGNLLSEAVKLPEGAQGLTGLFAETVGGFIGQVDSEAQETFTRFVTSGATADEITAFRTKARTAIASNIETVTGEESGRFTEMERRVTEETLKALQPGASKSQVTTAMAELLKLKIMIRGFQFLKAGIKPKYDLLAQGDALTENATRFVSDMRKFGMNDEQISDLFARLQAVQSEVGPVFAR